MYTCLKLKEGGVEVGLMSVLQIGMAVKTSVPRVLVIAGTTAVGKTDLSLELAHRLGGEIVSADSVQVYRHMDIGSAKVDVHTQQTIPHHLIDMVDNTQQFTAGDYHERATVAIQDIISRGRVPIVVGGTSFYTRFLLTGSTGSPVSTDETRAAVDLLLEEDGGVWEKSLGRLTVLDPTYAASLFPNDWYRLKRALDICLQSGRTVTSYKQDDKSLSYDFRCLFLTMPRVKLFHRIDSRCEQIVHNGLLKEVVSLVHTHNLRSDTQAGHSIGYRQALEYLDKIWGFPTDDGIYQTKIPLVDMKRHFLEFIFLYQARTRQLAQQQLVWYKKEPQFHWLNMAPGGERLSLPNLAERVREWFTQDVPLPEEWSGVPLQTLSSEEKMQLRMYTGEQIKRLTIYNNDECIHETLQELEHHLQSLTTSKHTST